MRKTYTLLVLLKKIIDIYIYINLHIALGAALSVFLCYATFKHIPNSDYPILVFFGTIFIYSSNRIFEAKKEKELLKFRRFGIFKKYNIFLFIYTILFGFGSLYFYIFLHPSLQALLLIPVILSLLYIVLLFISNRRQSNYDFINIVLNSIVWGFIIGIIPYQEANGTIDQLGLLYFLEKVIFIFAITIPFVVRDPKINKVYKAIAIPMIFEKKWAYKISILLMLVCIFIIWLEFILGTYNFKMVVYLSIGYLISIACIFISNGIRSIYFYFGLLQTTIIIVALLGIMSSGILSVLF